MEDAELLRRFESGELEHNEWNHRRHVRVAWCLLSRYSFDESLARMRRGLQNLADKFQLPDSLTTGYHETVTVAWLRLIAASMQRFGAGESSQEFLKEQPHFGTRTLLRPFYSKDRLLSEKAKHEFVEPDLARLPPAPVPHTEGVRRADRADRAALAKLDPHTADGRFGARVLRAIDAGGLFVVQRDGELIAYLMMDYAFFDRGFVDALYVHERQRRKGHAFSLMGAAIDACETPDVFTSTNESNAAMQALLSKLGFERCGQVDQLDPGDPEWFYVFHKVTP